MHNFLTDLQQHAFLQYACLAGLLASVACGIIGTYVVVRRITYIAGAISHTVLAGLGAALYLKRAKLVPDLDPLYGAVAAALLAALIVGLVSLRAKEREDTVIGAVWAIGMAIGILFVSQTPGYNTDLMSFLFGNILMVSGHDLWLMGLLDVCIVVLVSAFYNKFLSVCFDDEFARLRGVAVEFYYLLLLCLTALTVVVLVSVVGIVMVIALLTLPTAIASFFCKNLIRMMLMSAGLCALFTLSGLVVSYNPDFPAGATIIVIAGITYVAVLAVKSILSYGHTS